MTEKLWQTVVVGLFIAAFICAMAIAVSPLILSYCWAAGLVPWWAFVVSIPPAAFNAFFIYIVVLSPRGLY